MKTFIALALLLSPAAFAGATPNASSLQASNGTCYGGPGMYPYPCPAPTKPETCYGGPGMYPYPCARR